MVRLCNARSWASITMPFSPLLSLLLLSLLLLPLMMQRVAAQCVPLRFVRMERTVGSTAIAVAEVLVFDNGGSNVALSGTVTMSSTATAGSRSIDGTVDGSLFASTGGSDNPPWYRLNLNTDRCVNRVVVYPIKSNAALLNSFVTIELSVEDAAGNAIDSWLMNNDAVQIFHLDPTPTSTMVRYVRVINSMSNGVRLREVAVVNSAGNEIQGSGSASQDSNILLLFNLAGTATDGERETTSSVGYSSTNSLHNSHYWQVSWGSARDISHVVVYVEKTFLSQSMHHSVVLSDEGNRQVAACSFRGRSEAVAQLTCWVGPRNRCDTRFLRIEQGSGSSFAFFSEVMVIVGSDNVAVGKSASQSSTSGGLVATNCVNGRQQAPLDACRTSTSGYHQHWLLDLGPTFSSCIDLVRIVGMDNWNDASNTLGVTVVLLRSNGVPLDTFTIGRDGSDPYLATFATAGPADTSYVPPPLSPSTCMPGVRFIRLDSRSTAATLAVAEVEAYVGWLNIATALPPAAVTATCGAGDAHRAINGDSAQPSAVINGAYRCDTAAQHHFLEIDLGAAVCLDRVNVFADRSFVVRISDFELMALNENREVVEEMQLVATHVQQLFSGAMAGSGSLPAFARFVRVVPASAAGVALRELQLFDAGGSNVAASSPLVVAAPPGVQPPTMIVDGDTSLTNFGDTATSWSAFLEIDLGSVMNQLKSLVVYNRIDAMHEMLDGAALLLMGSSFDVLRVWTLNSMWVQELLVDLAIADVATCNVQFVRVEIGQANRVLHFHELLVFSEGENVAPDGAASQRSTPDADSAAQLCIDGNYDIDEGIERSCRTADDRNDNWWELNLGAGNVRCIDVVELRNWQRTSVENIDRATLHLLSPSRTPLRVLPVLATLAAATAAAAPPPRRAYLMWFNKPYAPPALPGCVSARFLRLEKTGGSIRVAEVEVHSGPLNVAINQAVTASSSSSSNPVSRANDGCRLSGAPHECVAMTDAGGSNSWIEIDLARSFCVDRVIVAAIRDDNALDCVNDVKLLDAVTRDTLRTWSFDESNSLMRLQIFYTSLLAPFPPPLSVRYVRVEGLQMIDLAVAEVSVFDADGTDRGAGQVVRTESVVGPDDGSQCVDGNWLTQCVVGASWTAFIEVDMGAPGAVAWLLLRGNAAAPSSNEKKLLLFKNENHRITHVMDWVPFAVEARFFNYVPGAPLPGHCDARFVRFEIGSPGHVHLVEFLVWVGAANVAPGSSLSLHPSAADPAGNCHDGSFFSGDTCSVPSGGPVAAFEVDLGSGAALCVDRVELVFADHPEPAIADGVLLLLGDTRQPRAFLRAPECLTMSKITFRPGAVGPTTAPYDPGHCINAHGVRLRRTTAGVLRARELFVYSGSDNVALNHEASGDVESGACALTDGQWQAAIEVASLSSPSGASLEVDFEATFCVDHLVLFKSFGAGASDDAMLELLDSSGDVVAAFVVDARPDQHVQMFYVSRPNASEWASGGTVRYVQLLAGTPSGLHFREIMALHDGANVALGKPAQLTSEVDPANTTAANCVDGDIHPLAPHCESLATIDEAMLIDLAEGFNLDSVVVFAGASLHGEVTVLLKNPDNVITNVFNLVGDRIEMFSLRAIREHCWTRYVRVEVAGVFPISMQEVEVISGGVNVALAKTATQHTDASPARVAGNCVDGIVGTNGWRNGEDHLCQTMPDEAAFWEVDLGADYCVDFVQLTGRTAGTFAETREMLVGATLLTLRESRTPLQLKTLHAQHVQTLVTNAAFTSVHPPGCVLASIVRVTRPSSSTGPVRMREVQVFSRSLNVALGREAAQSSVGALNSVGACTDGSTESDAECATEATTAGIAEWWEVALEGSTCVSAIVIHSSRPSADFMSGAVVSLLDASHTLLRSTELVGNQSVHVQRFGEGEGNTRADARFLRVEHGGTGPLQLREVMVLEANVNVALGRTARQRHDASAVSGAANAVDGSTAHLGESAVTLADQDAWFEIELDPPLLIDAIVIYNRMDDAADSLRGAAVVLQNALRAPLAAFALTANSMQMFHLDLPPPSCGIRRIRIQVATPRRLAMTEVLVYSGGSNIAVGAPAVQSATETAQPGEQLGAENCVDGDYSTQAPAAACTTEVSHSAFWEVDLGSERCLQRIVIVNRGDVDSVEVWGGLEGADILALSGATLLPVQHWRATSAQYQLFQVSPTEDQVKVRFLRVLQQHGQVQLREVEAFSASRLLTIDGAVATQSSIHSPPHADGSGAELCMNGNKTVVADANVCATAPGFDEWWQLDFGAPVCITAVHIFNRGDCCSVDLDRASLLFYDEDWEIVGAVALDASLEQVVALSVASACTLTPSATLSTAPTRSHSFSATATRTSTRSLAPTRTTSTSLSRSTTSSETATTSVSRSISAGTLSQTVSTSPSRSDSMSLTATTTATLTASRSITLSFTTSASVTRSVSESETLTQPPTASTSASWGTNTQSAEVSLSVSPTTTHTISLPSMTAPVRTPTPTVTLEVFYVDALRVASGAPGIAASTRFWANNVTVLTTTTAPDGTGLSEVMVDLHGMSFNRSDVNASWWPTQAGFRAHVQFGFGLWDRADEMHTCWTGFPCHFIVSTMPSGVYDMRISFEFIPDPDVFVAPVRLVAIARSADDTKPSHLSFSASSRRVIEERPWAPGSIIPTLVVFVQTPSNGSLVVNVIDGCSVRLTLTAASCGPFTAAAAVNATARISGSTAVFSGIALRAFDPACHSHVAVRAHIQPCGSEGPHVGPAAALSLSLAHCAPTSHVLPVVHEISLASKDSPLRIRVRTNSHLFGAVTGLLCVLGPDESYTAHGGPPHMSRELATPAPDDHCSVFCAFTSSVMAEQHRFGGTLPLLLRLVPPQETVGRLVARVNVAAAPLDSITRLLRVRHGDGARTELHARAPGDTISVPGCFFGTLHDRAGAQVRSARIVNASHRLQLVVGDRLVASASYNATTQAFILCNVMLRALNSSIVLRFHAGRALNATLKLRINFANSLCSQPRSDDDEVSGCRGVCHHDETQLCGCNATSTLRFRVPYVRQSRVRRVTIGGRPCSFIATAATGDSLVTHASDPTVVVSGCFTSSLPRLAEAAPQPVVFQFENNKHLQHRMRIAPSSVDFHLEEAAVITSVAGCTDAFPSTGDCSQVGNSVLTIHGRRLVSEAAEDHFVEAWLNNDGWGHFRCTETLQVHPNRVVVSGCAGYGASHVVELWRRWDGDFSLLVAVSSSRVTVSFRRLLEDECPLSAATANTSSNESLVARRCGGASRGICDAPSGRCVCVRSALLGYWAGPACDRCLDSHAGSESSSCTVPCPVDTSSGATCSDAGVCSNGQCACVFGAAGERCELRCPRSHGQECNGRGVCTASAKCECFANATHGFWDGNDGCTECRWGMTGSQCSVNCPRGGADDSVCSGHGNCNITCACERGFCGAACELAGDQCFACPTQGQWGPQCEEWCPLGPHGDICSGRGWCSDGRDGSGLCACDEGFWGVRCDGVCPGRPGLPCSGHGKCSRTSGACRCDPYFATADCSMECPGHRENNVCASHGVCIDGADGAGRCVCAPGYASANCSVECPGGVAQPCSGHGLCLQEGQGSCLCADDPVVGHWAGAACSRCAEDWQGQQCNRRCPTALISAPNGSEARVVCGGHGSCNAVIECECAENGLDGFWAGRACMECKSGYWGLNCTRECPGGWCNACSGHGVCSAGRNGTGECACFTNTSAGFWNGSSDCGECAWSWWGPGCNARCPGVVDDEHSRTVCDGRGSCSAGVGGSGACLCSTTFANDESGSCLDCAPAHFGPQCRPCGVDPPRGILVSCSGRGNCSDGILGDGSCACALGSNGTLCEYECPVGAPTTVAQERLATCGAGWCDRGACVCNRNYGLGSAALSAGGDAGDEAVACMRCLPGWWGPDCEFECPQCEHGNCTSSGMCACAEGYWGLLCDQVCPGGVANACSNRGTCDPTTGMCACTADPALGYFAGPACERCSPLYLSDHCNISCPTTGGIVCNGRGSCYNGSCTDCGPLPTDTEPVFCGVGCNLRGVQCFDLSYNCSDGFWGAGCVSLCPGARANGSGACSDRGLCNPFDGVCFCRYGLFGVECSSTCPTARGEDQVIRPCTGRGICTRDGTCRCNDGTWGDACESECPGGVATPCSGFGTCSPLTGSCDCSAGSVGHDCGTPCPGGRFHPCLGKGTCVAVINADGSEGAKCTCIRSTQTGFWDGETCDDCLRGFGGGDCRLLCDAENSVGSQSRHCQCSIGYGTPSCKEACPGVGTAVGLCNARGRCNDGALRDATCDCDPDWYDSGCTTFCTVPLCQAEQGLAHPQCNTQTGVCECQQDQRGMWDGPECNDCVGGFWGLYCSLPCPCNGRGTCGRFTGDCFCFRDDLQGYWAGRFCDRCLQGFIGADCRSRNIEMSFNSALEIHVGLFVNRTDLTAHLMHDPQHDVFLVGNRPLALMSTSDRHLLGVTDVCRETAVLGLALSESHFVVACHSRADELSAGGVEYFGIARGRDISTPVRFPTLATSHRNMRNLAANTANAAARVLAVDVAWRVHVLLHDDLTIIIAWDGTVVARLTVAEHGLSAIVQHASITTLVTEKDVVVVLLAGAQLHIAGGWTWSVFALEIERGGVGDPGVPFHRLFTGSNTFLDGCGDFDAASASSSTPTTTCEIAHRCTTDIDQDKQRRAVCILQRPDGPVAAALPLTNLNSTAFSAHMTRSTATFNVTAVEAESNPRHTHVDSEAPPGARIIYAAIHFGDLPSSIFKLCADTMVLTGVLELTGRSATLPDVIRSFSLDIGARIGSAVVVHQFAIRILSVNLFGIRNIVPAVLDSTTATALFTADDAGSGLVVRGEGFAAIGGAANVQCEFHDSDGAISFAHGIVVASDTIRCAVRSTAAADAGCDARSFNVRFLDTRRTSTTNVPLLRPAPAVITAAISSAGHSGYAAAGERATITLRGSGFARSPWASCRLSLPESGGAAIVDLRPVEFVNSSAAACQLPEMVDPTPAGSSVEYSHDGITFASRIAFSVVGEAVGLKITSSPLEIVADESSALPDVIVHVVDRRQNSLLRLHQPREVLKLSVQSQLNGTDFEMSFANSEQFLTTTEAGVAIFKNVSVQKPPVGNARLVVAHVYGGVSSITQLASASISMRVLTGTPRQLVLLQRHRQWRIPVLSPGPLLPPPQLAVADGAGNTITSPALLPQALACSFNIATAVSVADAKAIDVQYRLSRREVHSVLGGDGLYTFDMLVMSHLFGRAISLTFSAPGVEPLVTAAIAAEDCPDSSGEQYAGDGTQQCYPCPEGALCDGTTRVRTAPGFWRASSSSFRFYSCRPPHAPDTCTQAGLCADGYAGPRCSVCAAGYGLTYSTCHPCCSPAANWALIVLTFVAVLVAIAVLSATSIRAGRAALQESVEIPSYHARHATPSRGRPERKKVPIVMKLFVNHLQLSILALRVVASVPTFLNRFMEGQSAASNFDPRLNFITCEVAGNHLALFRLAMLTAPVLFVVFCLLCAAASFDIKVLSRSVEDDRNNSEEGESMAALKAAEEARNREELLGLERDATTHNEIVEKKQKQEEAALWRVVASSPTTSLPPITSQAAMEELFGVSSAPRARDVAGSATGGCRAKDSGSSGACSPRYVFTPPPEGGEEEEEDSALKMEAEETGAVASAAVDHLISTDGDESRSTSSQLPSRPPQCHGGALANGGEADTFLSRWVNSTLVCCVVIVFFLYPTLLSVSSDMLVCEPLDMGPRAPPLRVLVADRSIDCASAEYGQARVSALLMVAVYGVGAPLFSVFSVKLVQHTTAGGNMGVARNVFFFMTGGLRARWWMYEAVIMLRKAAVVVAVTVIENLRLRGYVVFWALLAFLALNFAANPWESRMLRAVESTSLVTLNVTLSLMLLLGYYAPEPHMPEPSGFHITAGAIVAVNVLQLFVFAAALMKALGEDIRSLALRLPFVASLAGLSEESRASRAAARVKKLRSRVALTASKLKRVHKRTLILHRATRAVFNLYRRHPTLRDQPAMLQALKLIDEMRFVSLTFVETVNGQQQHHQRNQQRTLEQCASARPRHSFADVVLLEIARHRAASQRRSYCNSGSTGGSWRDDGNGHFFATSVSSSSDAASCGDLTHAASPRAEVPEHSASTSPRVTRCISRNISGSATPASLPSPSNAKANSRSLFPSHYRSRAMHVANASRDAGPATSEDCVTVADAGMHFSSQLGSADELGGFFADASGNDHRCGGPLVMELPHRHCHHHCARHRERSSITPSKSRDPDDHTPLPGAVALLPESTPSRSTTLESMHTGEEISVPEFGRRVDSMFSHYPQHASGTLSLDPKPGVPAQCPPLVPAQQKRHHDHQYSHHRESVSFPTPPPALLVRDSLSTSHDAFAMAEDSLAATPSGIMMSICSSPRPRNRSESSVAFVFESLPPSAHAGVLPPPCEGDGLHKHRQHQGSGATLAPPPGCGPLDAPATAAAGDCSEPQQPPHPSSAAARSLSLDSSANGELSGVISPVVVPPLMARRGRRVPQLLVAAAISPPEGRLRADEATSGSMTPSPWAGRVHLRCPDHDRRHSLGVPPAACPTSRSGLPEGVACNSRRRSRQGSVASAASSAAAAAYGSSRRGSACTSVAGSSYHHNDDVDDGGSDAGSIATLSFVKIRSFKSLRDMAAQRVRELRDDEDAPATARSEKSVKSGNRAVKAGRLPRHDSHAVSNADNRRRSSTDSRGFLSPSLSAFALRRPRGQHDEEEEEEEGACRNVPELFEQTALYNVERRLLVLLRDMTEQVNPDRTDISSLHL